MTDLDKTLAKLGTDRADSGVLRLFEEFWALYRGAEAIGSRVNEMPITDPAFDVTFEAAKTADRCMREVAQAIMRLPCLTPAGLLVKLTILHETFGDEPGESGNAGLDPGDLKPSELTWFESVIHDVAYMANSTIPDLKQDWPARALPS